MHILSLSIHSCASKRKGVHAAAEGLIIADVPVPVHAKVQNALIAIIIIAKIFAIVRPDAVCYVSANIHASAKHIVVVNMSI